MVADARPDTAHGVKPFIFVDQLSIVDQIECEAAARH
jgi:hypothetical protein